MPGFAQNLANLATGGLYNQLSGRGDELLREKRAQFDEMYSDPEALREAAKYDPSILERLGNVLTGGIYGAATGMNDKLRAAQLAKQSLIQDELYRRMIERRRRYGMDQGTPGEIGSELNPNQAALPLSAMPSINTFAGGY